jgi:hypothetical protein
MIGTSCAGIHASRVDAGVYRVDAGVYKADGLAVDAVRSQ